MRRGRPSKFTPALFDEICERLEKGETLASICRRDGMPGVQTVSDWMHKNDELSVRIARARDLGFDAIAQEAVDIADETSRDTITTEKGFQIPDGEWISRSRLRVETRLKLLAKWCPKRYGEQLQVEHSGTVRAVIGGADA